MDFKHLILSIIFVSITIIAIRKFFESNTNTFGSSDSLKRFIFTALVMFISLMTMQYFFAPKNNTNAPVQAGEFITVASVNDYNQPIVTAINVDEDETLCNNSDVQDVQIVSTQECDISFAEQSGCLVGYTYHKKSASGNVDIEATYSHTPCQIVYYPFFIALDSSAPLCYKRNFEEEALINKPDATCLIYEARNEYAEIKKQFLVSSQSNVIDFTLTITPLKDTAQARILLPTPFEKNELGAGGGFVITGAGKFISIDSLSSNMQIAVQPPIVGSQGAYFLNALLQNASDKGILRRSYVIAGNDGRITTVIETPTINKKTTWNSSVYIGAREYNALKTFDKRVSQSMQSGWLAGLSEILSKILHKIYLYTHNYGLAIILLALFIRLIFLPLSYLSRGGTAKREEFMRKYKYVQERYKDDPERRALEQAELMKKYGALPGGLGCLPLLLQIPILFAFQGLLRSSIMFYHEPFVLWIQDLAKPDPYYILPAIFAFAMYIQVSRTMEAKQKFALIIAMCGMFAIFSKLSAGLALFAAVNILLGVAQVKFLKVQ